MTQWVPGPSGSSSGKLFRSCESRFGWGEPWCSVVGFTPLPVLPRPRGLRPPAVRTASRSGLRPRPGERVRLHESTSHGGLYHDHHIHSSQSPSACFDEPTSSAGPPRTTPACRSGRDQRSRHSSRGSSRPLPVPLGRSDSGALPGQPAQTGWTCCGSNRVGPGSSPKCPPDPRRSRCLPGEHVHHRPLPPLRSP